MKNGRYENATQIHLKSATVSLQLVLQLNSSSGLAVKSSRSLVWLVSHKVCESEFVPLRKWVGGLRLVAFSIHKGQTMMKNEKKTC